MQIMNLKAQKMLINLAKNQVLNKQFSTFNFCSKKELPTKSISELEEYWDEFSGDYTNKISGSQVGVYSSMLNMMNIETKKNILETGLGPGYMIPFLIQRKQQDAHLTLTDLSSQFLAISQKRLEVFQSNPFGNLYDFEIKKIQPFQGEKKEFKDFNLILEKVNSEKLPYKDNQFDAYISSLCLQLTTNPQNMINEAYRVLQKEGIASFSVWGDRKISYIFTVAVQILKEEKIKIPEARSNFHLGKKEKLNKMLEEAGFQECIFWNQFMPWNWVTRESEVDSLLGDKIIQQLLELIENQEQKQNIMKKIKQRYLQIIKNDHQAIGLDTLAVIARKL
ncbi:hypothetical protein PPERSA_00977 [Pseudocohnilembus persalinus]|uniref:Methyltransferase type 11 domain-containing protein n=1 Tax=Pseudocohnilembus persalinus TaxID=266149 RepID=A0A0V0R8I6_PSEPJ|nr:hypothetical protein PPERSA_00977 [Pseudocohnilembus persalinus]|eukprot:KRX10807.1 hypothetical protein PPERSA_00977 [Pseudocohnilembus persalinus]